MAPKPVAEVDPKKAPQQDEDFDVDAITPDEVILFSYGESETFVMPENMKVQLNSIALIKDFASGYWNHKGNASNAHFATGFLAPIEKDLVKYYKTQKEDDETPFDLTGKLTTLMSSHPVFSKVINYVNDPYSEVKDAPYLAELRSLLSGKQVNNLDELKRAGYSMAWIYRNKFDDYMSARGMMANLLHKDIMEAREHLDPKAMSELSERAHDDANRYMRKLLIGKEHMETFRKNFPIAFQKQYKRLPTEAEITSASQRHIKALEDAQYQFLYDIYLSGAALTKMDPSKMSAIDKEIYGEYMKSEDPHGGVFRLDDRSKKTIYPMMEFIAEMAVGFGAAAVVAKGAGLLINTVRGLKLFKDAGLIARVVTETVMFTMKIGAEALAFHDTPAAIFDRKTILETAFKDGKWEDAGLMLASESQMFLGFGILHPALQFLKSGKVAKLLMAYAAKNTYHKKVIDTVLELAKSSPAKAKALMESLVKNGGKLEKGMKPLPKEVLDLFQDGLKDIYLITGRYQKIINKIGDPDFRKVADLLLTDLQFDALAIMFGEAAKHKILPQEDANFANETLVDMYKKAFLTAGVFKAVFGGVGKLFRKVSEAKIPDALKKIFPKGMHESLLKEYKGENGEFIGSDGLSDMLINPSKFEKAMNMIEGAKHLILSTGDILLVTSKLSKEQMLRFLKACGRIATSSQKSEFKELVMSIELQPIENETTASRTGREQQLAETKRVILDAFGLREAGVGNPYVVSVPEVPGQRRAPEASEQTPGSGKPLTAEIRDRLALKYAEVMLNIQLVLGLGVAAEKVVAKTAEVLIDKAPIGAKDFAPEGRFNFSKERVSKMPKASEKSKVVLMDLEAKTPEESLRDFSDNFDFSVSQSSIFDGMKKAGVYIKDISAMEAAYASLPDFLKPYYRVFGANIDGQFVQRIAIDNVGFSKNVGYSSGDGSIDQKKSEEFVQNLQHAGFIDGLTGIVGKVIGSLAEKGIELSAKAIFSIIANNITSPKGMYGISVMIAYVYFLTKGKGKWVSLPLGLVWPLFPILKKIKALRLEEEVEAKPLKALNEIIGDLHLDGIEPKNHYGLGHNDFMQLVNSYNSLKPFFETLKGGHDLFTKVIQALFLKLRLKNIHERSQAINKRKGEIANETSEVNKKITDRQAEIKAELGEHENKVRDMKSDLARETVRLESLKATRTAEPLSDVEISRIESEVNALKAKITTLSNEIRTLETAVRKLEREKNIKIEDKRSKSSEISQLKASLHTSNTISELEENIRVLEEQISKTTDDRELSVKNSQLDKLRVELRKLKRIDELNREITALNTDVISMDSDIDAKNGEISAKSAEKAGNDVELTRLKTKLENPSRSLNQAQREQKEINIAECQGKIDDLKEKITGIEKDIAKLKDALEDESKDKVIVEAKKNKGELDAELKKLNEEAGKLHDEEHGLDATLNDPLNGLLYQIITDGWKFNVDKKLSKVDVMNSITKVLTDSGMPSSEARKIADAIVHIVDVLMIHPKSSKLRDLERSGSLIKGLKETDSRASGLTDPMAVAMNEAYQALQRSQAETGRSMGVLAKSWRFIDSLLPHNSAGRKLVAGIIVMLLGAGYYYANSKGIIGPAPSASRDKSKTPKLPSAPGTTGSPKESPSERRRAEESPVSGIDPSVGPTGPEPTGAAPKEAAPAPEGAPPPEGSKPTEAPPVTPDHGMKSIKDRLRKVGKLKE